MCIVVAIAALFGVAVLSIAQANLSASRVRMNLTAKLDSQIQYIEAQRHNLTRIASDNGLAVEDQSATDQRINAGKDFVSRQKYSAAQDQLNQAQLSVAKNWITLLPSIAAKQKEAHHVASQPAQPAQAANSVLLPILLYHKPPANFEAQLNQLAAKGYTTVTMAEVASYLTGQAKPPTKPAVITFDDGFTDQLNAMASLQRHHMKATLYLITAGERSHWCIGIERRPGNCGDSYLNWDQIKQMMSTGLIEIGGHTVDHPSLPTLTPADQTFEIVSNKQRLESMLGVHLTTFAYPYGSFNTTTINIVKQAGYYTAVSTISGLYQSPDTIYALRRVRAVSELP